MENALSIYMIMKKESLAKTDTRAQYSSAAFLILSNYLTHRQYGIQTLHDHRGGGSCGEGGLGYLKIALATGAM